MTPPQDEIHLVDVEEPAVGVPSFLKELELCVRLPKNLVMPGSPPKVWLHGSSGASNAGAHVRGCVAPAAQPGSGAAPCYASPAYRRITSR